MNKVATVVVTFNRKELLKKNIEALLNQTCQIQDIIIIDNASTDGTYEYIKEYIDDNRVLYENTKTNLGGAGGFNYGMKIAVDQNYEYIWLMDDDTIPYENALDELIQADQTLAGQYGFLSSTVLWKDGTPCKMNKQKQTSDWYMHSQNLKDGLIKIYHATFVSFFVKVAVVREMGFPIKEFFIWGDDVEYSNRIAKNYNCYVAGKSQVVHYTENNEGSNIAKDSKDRINRYKFAYRNEFYIAKKNGIKGILRQVAKIGLHIFRVIVFSKEANIKKIGVILGSSIKGIFFNPQVEYHKK